MTTFQEKCYQMLLKIPKGKVITYSQLATMVGIPKAARAVGSAMRKNPNSPTVPCHRVVRANGSIGQYNKGQNEKIKLLKEEGIKISNKKVLNLEKYLYK